MHKHISILKEGIFPWLALFVAEELYSAAGKGLNSSLTESEFLILFQKKYSEAIKVAENIFSNSLLENIKSKPPEFFSLESISKEIIYKTPETLEEAKNIGLGNLSSLIFESSMRYAKGGMGDKNKLTTSQVEFSWGKYNYPDPRDKNFKNKSVIASSDYWIKEGEADLGSVQFKGDPFTYSDAGGGDLEVISGPGSIDPNTGRPYRDSIGKVFSTLEKDEELGGSKEANLDEIVASTIPSDDEIDKAKKDIAREEAEKDSQERKDRIIAAIERDMAKGYISVLAWAALKSNSGDIRAWTIKVMSKIRLSIKVKGLVRDKPEICKSRLGMIMIVLAEEIDEVGRRSIKNFSAGNDVIFEDTFSLQGEFLDTVEPFLAYIESVKNTIRDTILEKYIPLANMGAITDDDVNQVWGSKDRCGYSVDPRDDGTYRTPTKKFKYGPRGGAVLGPYE